MKERTKPSRFQMEARRALFAFRDIFNLRGGERHDHNVTKTMTTVTYRYYKVQTIILLEGSGRSLTHWMAK